MSKATRRVLVEKYNREKAAESYFINILQLCYKENDYDNNDCYIYDNKVLMKNSINGNNLLWIDYELWLVFEEKYGYTYDEIQKLIIKLVANHFGLMNIIPQYHIHLR